MSLLMTVEAWNSHVAILFSGGWTTLATCRLFLGACSVRDPCESSLCYLSYLVPKVIREDTAHGRTRLSGVDLCLSVSEAARYTTFYAGRALMLESGVGNFIYGDRDAFSPWIRLPIPSSPPSLGLLLLADEEVEC